MSPFLLVVMGVSGSGKTTVGIALAAALNIGFEDADDLHPAANVAKMASGHALTDDDRVPWLAAVGAQLNAASNVGLVVACSALKRSYRQALLAAEPRIQFVYLEGSRPLLEARLGNRQGHFMPASLLDSQLATLQPLEVDEPGLTVSLDANLTPAALVEAITAQLV